MKTHTLQLAAIPFATIARGVKTIESRLYDEKRQTIKVGDTIVFINRDDTTQTIKATVINLHKHANFHALFSHLNPAKFGGPSVAWLENQINEFYSPEAQQETGVIGIEFRLK